MHACLGLSRNAAVWTAPLTPGMRRCPRSLAFIALSTTTITPVHTVKRHQHTRTARLLAWFGGGSGEKTTSSGSFPSLRQAVALTKTETDGSLSTVDAPNSSSSSSHHESSDSPTSLSPAATSSSSGSVSKPLKLRKARPSPRALSQVKQTPLFPGMFRHVSVFEGEHVYHYGLHTYTIFKESMSMAVIPAGCLFGYLVTHMAACPPVTLTMQAVCLALLFAASRVMSAGRRNKLVKDLTGRHVVVTGGTSGIGRATAAQLASMGADVTLLAKESTHAQPAVDFVKRHAPRQRAEVQEIVFQALDLEDFIAVREYCKRMRQRQTPIDILVNAAGCLQQHQVTTRFGDDVMLAANFLGPYLLTEGLLPLVQAAHGRIVYVACSAHVGVRGNAVATYLSGRGVWSPRVANKFDSLEQYGFTKLGNIFHAQQLALRSYPEIGKASKSARFTQPQPSNAAGGAAYEKRKRTLTPRLPGYAAAAAASAEVNPAGTLKRSSTATPHGNVVPHFTACACSPGGVITNLYRHVLLASSFKYFYYLYVLIMRTAWEGSQTVVNCCVRDDFKNGGYYMNTRYQPTGLSRAACSVTEREQVMTWTLHKMRAYMKWD